MGDNLLVLGFVEGEKKGRLHMHLLKRKHGKPQGPEDEILMHSLNHRTISAPLITRIHLYITVLTENYSHRFSHLIRFIFPLYN